ncbi:uncharacterized protein LOC128999386 [Macrosteles quadrilineatus]|uniref:uncharacterized protein LOC128999386 n=1 Tax=Macrosteles quadrilineatus TaxID=74068 RepID=UPI0023E31D04|nr:uncharacterized protein LOC128999386 [Macrosteles quadrilineatus]
MRRYLALFLLLAAVGPSIATFGIINEVFGNAIDSWFNPRICGDCPPVPDCRVLPAVNLGYCCGCRRFPFDNARIFCAPDLICPPNRRKLCGDYYYLMDCCCTNVIYDK